MSKTAIKVEKGREKKGFMLSVKKWYIPLRITELLSGRRRQKENVFM